MSDTRETIERLQAERDEARAAGRRAILSERAMVAEVERLRADALESIAREGVLRAEVERLRRDLRQTTQGRDNWRAAAERLRERAVQGQRWPADREGWCCGCGGSMLGDGGPFHAPDCPAIALDRALDALGGE